MPEITGVALSLSQVEHSRRWDRLRADIFGSLAPPDALLRAIDTARIEDDGLGLLIPGVDEQALRRLRYAMRSRRLFTPEDLEVAANLAQNHELAAESRRACERGVILERDRISRDIHDNIGATALPICAPSSTTAFRPNMTSARS